jgi:phospholipid/cholesterol/gamma-HCH transport system substrate-binding protein
VGLLRTTLDARTIASLQQSAANLEAVSRTLAANNARMQAILLDAQRATAQMPTLVQSGMQTLRDVQTGLLPQAGGTLTRIGGVTDQMQDTLMVTRTQLLPEAQQTAERLDELSGALADTADRIRRNPALLVRGARPRPGPGEAP